MRREVIASLGSQDRVRGTDAHQAQHLHLLMDILVVFTS